MSHLSHEALGRLVDERPAESEAAHLASCEACRTELDAMREAVQALALLPDLAPAPDAWHALEARLLDEGLMRRRVPGFPATRYLQAAAALVLLVAGAAVGRFTAEPDAVLVAQLEQAAAANRHRPQQPQDVPAQVAETPPDAGVRLAGAQHGAAMPESVRPQQRPSPVSLASSGARLPQARSIDEAASLLRQTEEWYLAALTRYAELTTQADANDPIARLAALHSIVITTQAALSQTPSDPVVNGAHLTAVAQRDAALRQVAAATGDRWH
jgi:hypothetical protein